MTQHLARPRPQVAGILLLCSAVFIVVGLSCSVGETLVGRSTVAAPTATKTPRPTFTPLPAAAGAQRPTPELAVRGVLPPGVTVAAPGGPAAPAVAAANGQPAAAEGNAGRTSLVLIATLTPPPSPTPLPTGMPTATPTRTPDVETNRPTRVIGPRPYPTPYVVVTADAANGRRGPGATFELLGQAQRDDELMILARTPNSDWWQVCCISNQPAWVAADSVSPKGPLEEVPVLTPAPTPPPTPIPPPPPTATRAPTPLPPFDIARGPEFPIKRDTGVLTIWVKVYEGPWDNQKALPGYVLVVFRNNVEVSDFVQSHGPPFDNTKPEGSFDYNLKFEMNHAGEADWRIYLARPGGYRVSPIKEFTTKGDSYRNLVVFVAYWLAR
jgi:hypothetical protein